MHRTDEELAVLKSEFGHHAEKLDEYDQMRKEIDRLEGKCYKMSVFLTSMELNVVYHLASFSKFLLIKYY